MKKSNVYILCSWVLCISLVYPIYSLYAQTTTPLTVTCSPVASTTYAGQGTTWTATASGGTGTYTYAWSGTDAVTGTGGTAPITYQTEGTKTASVTVTSGSAQATANCGSIIVSPPVLTGLCTASVSSGLNGQ